MSNDLALLEEKIHQLPPHLISKADDFITDLLQKYQSHKLPAMPYRLKPVSLGLKVTNVDNIAEILEQYE